MQKLSSSVETDVVVIGAGFAGITAARRLSEAGKKVAVVEAKDRIGGRTYTKKLYKGLNLDVGGQWIGPPQTRITKLTRDFGIETFQTYQVGKNVAEDNGKTKLYTGVIPKLGLGTLAGFGYGQLRLDLLAKKVDLREPWNTPNAAYYDSVTLERWMNANVFPAAGRDVLYSAMQQLLSAHPSRVSLLHAMYFIKTAGGLDPLFAVEGGAQHERFRHGTISLLRKMTEPFEKDVYLDSPVRRIEQGAGGVKVICDGGSVSAKYAVVTLPPVMAGKIEYSPSLSADRDQLHQTVPMGSVIKVIAFYEKPFWREKGMSGHSVSAKGPLFTTFDNGLPGEEGGALVGFVVGRDAETYRRLSLEERRSLILRHLATCFGAEAATPAHYHEESWVDDIWTRGCFLGYFPTGVLTSVGRTLWQPEGRIHWAGTETARAWQGYIEGAVESGERAAAEVASRLK